MKKRNVLALLLVLALMFSMMVGCGAKEENLAPEESAPTQEEAPKEEAAPEETPAEDEAEPAPEAEAPAHTITYPIEGGHVLTMTNVYNPNASRVLGDGDYTLTETYDLLVERTGVEIKFQMLPESTFSTQLDLIIASGDYPDMFGRSIGTADNDLMKAIEDDIVIDMVPLMEEYAPDIYRLFTSDDDWHDALVNSDGTVGKMSGWAMSKTTSGLFLRQDWLDGLGMEVPGTKDELTDMLRAFKSEYDCRNAILVDADLGSGLGDLFNSTAMGFMMLSYQLTAPNSGVVECAYASQGYIDYLMYLNQLYSEGLITDDFLNIHKNVGNLEEQYVMGYSGVWNDDAKYTYANQTAAQAEDPNWSATAFYLDKSDNHVTQTVSGGTTSMTTLYISGCCEYPEVAMQFLNYGFTQEGSDLILLGEEGVSYNILPDGKVEYTEDITNNPDGLTSEQAKYKYLAEPWLPTVQQERVFEMSYTPQVMEAYNIWSSAEGGDDSMIIPREVRLSSTDQSRVFEISSDVVTLFNENAAKVIFGEITVDDYRAVIETANEAGMAEITEIYQKTYDAYMAENA
ncbi:MAG: extracellular solute-binding protein [Ruminococcaceae bacterium]|nr:extracellular solute-binding protein [Oscillospiraceae bacterium]